MVRGVNLAVNTEEVLIVGADGLIGKGLIEAYNSLGISVAGTSRRNTNNFFFLDLANPIDLSALPKAKTIFLCAGINGFDACNKDPVQAAQVNMVSMLSIGTHYIKQGGHVIFLSSTAVFGTKNDKPSELRGGSPNTTYGAFKWATEMALIEATKNSNGKCSIVRLTKVFSGTSLLLTKWKKQGFNGQSIDTFSNITLAPISLNYVVSGLLSIANYKTTGHYHLAGEQVISYADLADALYEKWLIPNSMIKRVNQSVNSEACYQCTDIAMDQTSRMLNIRPQTFKEFLNSID